MTPEQLTSQRNMLGAMMQGNYDALRKKGDELGGSTNPSAHHRYTQRAGANEPIANILACLLLKTDSWIREAGGSPVDRNGVKVLDLTACCLTGRNFATGIANNRLMRDIGSNLTDEEKERLFGVKTGDKLSHLHCGQYDFSCYNDGGIKNRKDPTMNKPSEELDKMSTEQLFAHLCKLIDDEVPCITVLSGVDKSSIVVGRFREDPDYEVTNALPDFEHLNPQLKGKFRTGPQKDLLLVIRHRTTGAATLFLRVYQGSWGYTGNGKVTRLVNIRKHNYASAAMIILYLLTGRVNDGSDEYSLESVCPRLMKDVDTDEDGELQRFVGEGGLWKIMASGGSLVSQYNKCLWVMSMYEKTCHGGIYVGNWKSFALIHTVGHDVTAIVEEEKLQELEHCRVVLTQAAEQIKSGQELTVLNVKDLEEVALTVGTARFNVGLAGKAAFFRKMHEKIANMTETEKDQIVAEALNKPLEKRTGLENLLVYRGRVGNEGNEGKNLLVLFNYFLYINFLINF